MPRTTPIEDFIPHREPVSLNEIRTALADLGTTETVLGLSVPLPYTRRPDGAPLAGTVDTIEIGPFGGDTGWMVYTGRDYHGQGCPNITSTVGRIPGHMVILVVRALYAHLTAVGPQGRTDTAEGHILYALGLVRPVEG